MKDLEAKMAEAKAKKDQIIARARTAKASTKVNDMLAGVGSSSSAAPPAKRESERRPWSWMGRLGGATALQPGLLHTYTQTRMHARMHATHARTHIARRWRPSSG